MEAQRHPAYPAEHDRLTMTKRVLDEEQAGCSAQLSALKQEIDDLSRASGGDFNQDLVNKNILFRGVRSRVEALPYALKKPYFARLDFREDRENEHEQIYLGKLGVQRGGKELIVDWRAPIANIYYSSQVGPVAFQAPSRVLGDLMTVRGDLSLKRQFIIDDSQLKQIFDRELSVQDELLQAVLESGASQRLKEVVSTIQEEQNAVIRADKDQILIVQGVAGSGKTTVALHRLAYLIYTYQTTLPAERILVVGPNELFLTYISEVLPELGVSEVRQTTFAGLALALIGRTLTIHETDRRLFEPGLAVEMPAAESRLARFKGTLGMKRLIDGYVRHLETILLPPEDLELEGEVAVLRAELQDYFERECYYLPLTARAPMVRNYCARRLKTRAEELTQTLKHRCDLEVLRIKSTMSDEGERRWKIGALYDTRDRDTLHLKKSAVPTLNRYMKRWPEWDLLELYRHLLDDPDRASEWSEGSLSAERAREFAPAFAAQLAGGEVAYEDLAPLVHLQARVFGLSDFVKPLHVVVDEAQDYSVFQYSILRELSAQASFTIVGDLAQGIHAYRSIRDWEELADVVFSDAPRAALNLTKSYRSAMEIMQVANAVIERLPGRRFAPADPVLRHCPRPVLTHGQAVAQTRAAIPGVIHAMREGGCKSVACVGRTAAECRELHDDLTARLSEPVQLVTEKVRDYEGRLVVIPVYLAKGLEFDGIIIADVSETNYQLNELDVKMLYVACTRAMHRLHLLCAGAESPILSAISPEVLERQTLPI